MCAVRDDVLLTVLSKQHNCCRVHGGDNARPNPATQHCKALVTCIPGGRMRLRSQRSERMMLSIGNDAYAGGMCVLSAGTATRRSAVSSNHTRRVHHCCPRAQYPRVKTRQHSMQLHRQGTKIGLNSSRISNELPMLPVYRSSVVSRRTCRQLTSTNNGGPDAALKAASVAQESISSGSNAANSKVAIFVEPSPFSHVSGMKNRFECLIKGLRQAGDEVLVVTPDPHAPEEYNGARVINVLGFRLPFYSTPTLLLSTAISVRVLYYLWNLRPSIIHVSTPGVMVFAATLYAKLLQIPLVMSYHTHIPEYIPKYTWQGLVQPMWSIIRWCTRRSDLTLVTSQAMKEELAKNLCRIKSIDVWQRGVDTDVFNPKYRNAEMRARMTNGHPDQPLLVYVGRLGTEKNCMFLKEILDRVPGVRLAFVGDGPQRKELEEAFKDTPTVFMGMMRGEELSQAYASGDIFVMPSETETLGFVVLEAMASGLPVVSVAAGGLIDILKSNEGKIGFLFPPGDGAKAAQLVQSLVQDPQLQARIGAAARAEMEKFGWSAATKTLREKQYIRAIKMSIGRRRFGFLALRVGIGRLLHLLWTGLLALIQVIGSRLGLIKTTASPIIA